MTHPRRLTGVLRSGMREVGVRAPFAEAFVETTHEMGGSTVTYYEQRVRVRRRQPVIGALLPFLAEFNPLFSPAP
jgi:hypothetical protein